MRHGKLTRDEAIAVVGEEAIRKLDETNCEPTSRLQTDGDEDEEWSAYIRTPDKCGERVTVEAYYYITPEQSQIMADHDGDGSSIDWTIEGYEIEGMGHDAVKDSSRPSGARAARPRPTPSARPRGLTARKAPAGPRTSPSKPGRAPRLAEGDPGPSHRQRATPLAFS
jgi:hypothetical protein